jgi:hypothetical protein
VSLLLDALRGLGLGGQLLVAATLLMGGVYAWKGAKTVNLVAAYAASGMLYVVVLLVAIGLAIAAGWIDPNPGAFLSFVGDVVDAVLGAIGDRLSGVIR